jgi:hypothetical protein
MTARDKGTKERTRNIVVGIIVMSLPLIILMVATLFGFLKPLVSFVILMLVISCCYFIVYIKYEIWKSLHSCYLEIRKLAVRQQIIIAEAVCILVFITLWVFWKIELGWFFSLFLCFWVFNSVSVIVGIFRPVSSISELRFKTVVSIVSELIWILGFIFMFGYIYSMKGIYLNDGSHTIVTNFTTCIYFSIVTFTTLGYGDFCPTPATRGIAALEAIIGLMAMGLVLSTFVHLLQIVTIKNKNNTQENNIL